MPTASINGMFVCYPRQFRLVSATLVFRHGDRCPSLNFMAPGALHAAERNLWASKLPATEDLQRLAARFPVGNIDCSPSNAAAEQRWRPRPDDEQEQQHLQEERGPFGQLTRLGLSQLRKTGRKLRARYNSTGTLTADNMLVFSTNYARTQQSAQSLLHGFFEGRGTGEDDIDDESDDNDNDNDDDDDDDIMPAETETVRIHVPPVELDVANSWDALESMRDACGAATREDPFFEEKEAHFLESRQALTQTLPHYRENPDKFLWIYACDYFVCRQSHALPIAPELEVHRGPTLEHAFARFLRWYHDSTIGDLCAGGLLRCIREQMQRNVNGYGVRMPDKKMVLFSGHDITLLPLLCALGLRKGSVDNPDFDTEWPKYATCMAFELMEDQDPRIQNNDDRYFVRVLYNDEEVIPATPFREFWKTTIFPLDPKVPKSLL